ncbi:MAG: Fe-S protein assembly co-chaperone HscB [Magnetococcales bacterium]|nr:Fe-S protein assembly co-chaperone HscB [Magnetococcales bacterium]
MSRSVGDVVCWSCRGGTPSGFFCATCDAILPLDARLDFFRLFALEPTFEVDLVALEVRYRELQKRLHPDFFASRGALERRLSLEHVTRVNEAWQTLTDPLARAGYLLRLEDWKPDHGSSDLEFLGEVMELRESLEELDPKAPDAMARLAALRGGALERVRDEEKRMGALFLDYFREPDRECLVRIGRLADRMRYHRRYLEELDRLEDQAFE